MAIKWIRGSSMNIWLRPNFSAANHPNAHLHQNMSQCRSMVIGKWEEDFNIFNNKSHWWCEKEELGKNRKQTTNKQVGMGTKKILKAKKTNALFFSWDGRQCNFWSLKSRKQNKNNNENSLETINEEFWDFSLYLIGCSPTKHILNEFGWMNCL